eukprot:TRINITY_DN64634_c3_g1_i1.p3 TRINITY_DN64634_c3_g1~~TRINITY_DN64634_c3_g1_i1.p3  ORF type:complete len:378 (-),score=42.57 TRINITY_DN64634_c3_g1_i1:1351-2385(-)
MEPQSHFDLFTQKYKRDINCLTDEVHFFTRVKTQNRAIRFNALKRLLTELPKEPDETARFKLFINNLMKPLTYVFEDKIEKNREAAIKIASSHIEKFGFSKDCAIILTGVLARLNATPFPEPCIKQMLIKIAEEVRISLLKLAKLIVEKNEIEVIPFLPELTSALSKVLLDPNPAMKEECAVFLGVLSHKLKAKLGHHSKAVLHSLIQNTKHQRSKVRRLSIRAIGDVIKTENAPPLLKDIIAQLKPLVNDKIADVRKELYTVVREWLASFDITYLRMFECDLVLFLLAGVGDESPEIAQHCVDSLEFYGSNLQKLLVEIGEDVSGIDPHSFDEKFQKRMAEVQ